MALDEQSRAGQAFHNIAARMEGEDVPLMDLSATESGFLGRLSGLFRSGSATSGGRT